MAKENNGTLGINYDKELDANMIKWIKKKRNYSGYIRDLLYKEMEKEQGILVVKEELKPISKSILSSIDNL